MYKKLKYQCPNCGAIIDLEDVQKDEILFCDFCGAQIIIDCEKVRHEYKNEDIARIREAEMQAQIRLKELELQEKKFHFKILGSMVLGVAGTFFTILGVIGCSIAGNKDHPFSYFIIIGLGMLLLIFINWCLERK